MIRQISSLFTFNKIFPITANQVSPEQLLDSLFFIEKGNKVIFQSKAIFSFSQNILPISIVAGLSGLSLKVGVNPYALTASFVLCLFPLGLNCAKNYIIYQQKKQFSESINNLLFNAENLDINRKFDENSFKMIEILSQEKYCDQMALIQAMRTLGVGQIFSSFSSGNPYLLELLVDLNCKSDIATFVGFVKTVFPGKFPWETELLDSTAGPVFFLISYIMRLGNMDNDEQLFLTTASQELQRIFNINNEDDEQQVREIMDMLIDTPKEERYNHFNNLLAAIAAQNNAHLDNQENVMEGKRQKLVKQTILNLKNHFHLVNLEQNFTNLENFAQKLYSDLQSNQLAPNYASLAERRGKNHTCAIENALRVLSGKRRAGDYSESIRQMADVKELCSLIWHAIGHYHQASLVQTQQDQELMRLNLIASLGQCIEDDGHRVCSIGQFSRIVQVVQGYLPLDLIPNIDLSSITPSQVATALFQDLKKTIDLQAEQTPTRAEIDAFCKEAFPKISAAYPLMEAQILAEFQAAIDASGW